MEMKLHLINIQNLNTYVVGDRGCDDIRWVEGVISVKEGMPQYNEIPGVNQFGLNFIGPSSVIGNNTLITRRTCD